MEKFKTFAEAEEAAANFFIEHFEGSGNVGVRQWTGIRFEFYSKDDPGMDDTFECIIDGDLLQIKKVKL